MKLTSAILSELNGYNSNIEFGEYSNLTQHAILKIREQTNLGDFVCPLTVARRSQRCRIDDEPYIEVRFILSFPILRF